MPEELGNTLNYLSNINENDFGDLKIFSGEWVHQSKILNPIYLSVAWSGWGKVSSSRAATRLISNKFAGRYIDALFFIGVAGGIDSRLERGDIVIATKLIQHDMDARPIFKKYVMPALNEKFLYSDENWVNWAFNALENGIKKGEYNSFGDIYKGLIATGDKFVSTENSVKKLKKDFNDLLGVEMEGAAVAQVASQEKIPFQIIRVISDKANASSHKDFEDFLKNYQKDSVQIVKSLVENIYSSPLFSSIK